MPQTGDGGKPSMLCFAFAAACVSICVMKRAAAKRTPRRRRLPEVDVGQIIEMLRLTPTERLRKAWRYSELALEVQRAAGLRPRDQESR